MKLIAILIVGIFGCAAGAATPVDLKFKISGPDGPLANFSLRASYRRSEKPITPKYAKTDQTGEVVFHLNRDIDTEVEIKVGDPSDGKTTFTAEDDAASDASRTLIAHLGLPPLWVVRLPEGTAEVQRTVTVPRARSVRVMIPEALTNPLRWASLGVAGYTNTMCTIDRATRKLTREGIPIDQAFTGYFTFDESNLHGRSIPISIPAGSSDVDLPEITITPVAYNAFILIDQISDSRLAPVAALEGISAPGVTLVSSDGLMIVSAISNTDGKSKVPVPPGTYYYAPGMMGPDDFQVKLIQKLVAGADLSAVFPHVTVAAGETKTLQVNPVDILYKIYELP